MSRSIDKLLDKLQVNNGLTSDGRAWLVAAADPFHDADLRIAGYPDVTTASTVVQLVKKQFQVSVPTGGAGNVPSGQNWDCSIALFPWGTQSGVNTYGSFNPSNGTWTLTGTTAVTVGGMTVSAGPQGNALWPSPTVSTPVATYSGLDCKDYCKGNCRIIGMGMEVVNTTAEINLQGQVTAWRMPNIITPMSITIPVATTPPSAFNTVAKASRFPPGTLGDAQLLFGSRSWAAKEGAYVVSRLTDTSNKLVQPDTCPIVCLANDIDASALTNVNTYSVGTPAVPATATLTSNFDISGLHFTGLSYATTLTVNVRWLIERMPGPREADLVVLATPSALYDPVALRLYTECLHDMPPGCMLSENPLGEWFRSVMSAASDILPVLGNALNQAVPGAGAVGQSLGQLAKSFSTPIAVTNNGTPVFGQVANYMAKGQKPVVLVEPRTLPGSASNTMVSAKKSAAPLSSGGVKRLGITVKKTPGGKLKRVR